METSLFVSKEDGTTDAWCWRDLPPAHIGLRERDTPLGRAYALWCNAQETLNNEPFESLHPLHNPSDRPPAASNFRFSNPDSFYVDVREPNPLDFALIMPDFPSANTKLSHLEPEIIQRVFALEFVFMREEAAPSYQQVYQLIDGVAHVYVRMLLPVAAPDGSVERIYCYQRPLMAIEKPSFQISMGKI